MSNIKDKTLYKSGLDKIEWVKSYMPVLSSIEKEFIEKQPFKGMRITTSIHLEAKTAYLVTVLANGGAQVCAAGCNPLSTQDDIAAALVSLGIEVFAVHGESEEEYFAELRAALAHKPDVIVDDGGDLALLLHGELRDIAKNLRGECEETTTGIRMLKKRAAAGELLYPAININDADCKHLFDNRYGTGQSTLNAIMQATNLTVAGKCVVVAGYGWCGRGIAMRVRGMGGRVIVTEIDAVKALEAMMDGFEVMEMDDAAPLGDLFITATGCKDVITKKHLLKMKDGVLLSNSGHFDVEINKRDLADISERCVQRKPDIEGYYLPDGRILNLLAEGRLVNLAAGNGHPAEIMDMSFSLQAKCLEYLATNRLPENKLYSVPAEIDREVAKKKLAAMGIKIDALSPEQKDYFGE